MLDFIRSDYFVTLLFYQVQKSLDSVQGLLEQQQSKLHSLALDLASTQVKWSIVSDLSFSSGRSIDRILHPINETLKEQHIIQLGVGHL